MLQLDDVTFQVFKDGEYGAYLDLDLSLSEQQEEIEGLEVRLVFKCICYLIFYRDISLLFVV